MATTLATALQAVAATLCRTVDLRTVPLCPRRLQTPTRPSRLPARDCPTSKSMAEHRRSSRLLPSSTVVLVVASLSIPCLRPPSLRSSTVAPTPQSSYLCLRSSRNSTVATTLQTSCRRLCSHRMASTRRRRRSSSSSCLVLAGRHHSSQAPTAEHSRRRSRISSVNKEKKLLFVQKCTVLLYAWLEYKAARQAHVIRVRRHELEMTRGDHNLCDGVLLFAPDLKDGERVLVLEVLVDRRGQLAVVVESVLSAVQGQTRLETNK